MRLAGVEIGKVLLLNSVLVYSFAMWIDSLDKVLCSAVCAQLFNDMLSSWGEVLYFMINNLNKFTICSSRMRCSYLLTMILQALLIFVVVVWRRIALRYHQFGSLTACDSRDKFRVIFTWFLTHQLLTSWQYSGLPSTSYDITLYHVILLLTCEKIDK